MLLTRMRAGGSWSNATILNLSSRGLMVDATAGALQADKVELWHGEHFIVATVIWRRAMRAGLRAENPIPVDSLMALSQTPSLQLSETPQWPQVERRRRPRAGEDSRFQARAFEFGSITVIAAFLVVGTFAMIEQACATPLHFLNAALGG
jgi:hypothetical protein